MDFFKLTGGFDELAGEMRDMVSAGSFFSRILSYLNCLNDRSLYGSEVRSLSSLSVFLGVAFVASILFQAGCCSVRKEDFKGVVDILGSRFSATTSLTGVIGSKSHCSTSSYITIYFPYLSFLCLLVDRAAPCSPVTVVQIEISVLDSHEANDSLLSFRPLRCL